MQSDYILLTITGAAGALLLLGIEVLPGVRAWRKPLTALLLSLVTALWALLPSEGRWMLSVWSPSTALGGVLVWDLSVSLWRLGLALGIAFSGVAWVEAVDSRPALPLSGTITLAALMAAWHALAGGSMLTTLAVWAVFDVLWGVAGLLSGNDGERVAFGLFAHGSASLGLWVAFLLLSRGGGGTLWWLLWPSSAVSTLLVAVAFLRIGLYPFQIVFPRRLHIVGPMVLVALLGPVLGLGLLYRILLLPAGAALPAIVTAMGTLSLLWGGVRAWIERGKPALLWASYGLLGGIAASTAATGLPMLLPAALGIWLLCLTLLLVLRRWDARAVFWAWPGVVALLLLLGAPPSPLGNLFRAALATLPWGWRLLFLCGWAFTSAALLQWVCRPGSRSAAPALEGAVRVTPMRAWQQAGLFAGFALPLGGAMFSFRWEQGAGGFAWSGFLLWILMLVLMLGLFWAASSGVLRQTFTSGPQRRKSEWLRAAEGVVEILDLQWLHRALWRGLEHLLSFVRVFFEVVEGSSALLWSLLVLLVVFLVVINR